MRRQFVEKVIEPKCSLGVVGQIFRRSAEMAWYRMYFVDRLARFRFPHDLYADNDRDALALAHALQYACSDIHVGVELWQGARRVPGASNKSPEALRANWEL